MLNEIYYLCLYHFNEPFIWRKNITAKIRFNLIAYIRGRSHKS